MVNVSYFGLHSAGWLLMKSDPYMYAMIYMILRSRSLGLWISKTVCGTTQRDN